MATKKSVSKKPASKTPAKKSVSKKPASKTPASKQLVSKTSAHGAWLIKSEPSVYPWEKLVEDGTTFWDGVRNYEARNNLRGMKKGDLLLFYHSNEGKEIVGLAKVTRESYADPTSDEDWSVVDLAPMKKLVRPVTLAAIKAEKSLASMQLVKKSRISVVPVTSAELTRILAMAGTTL